MPALRLTRCLPATAVLGVGLVLGTAQPAVADPAPVAKVTARGEREMSADSAPAARELLLLVVAMGGLAIGAGGVVVANQAHRRGRRSAPRMATVDGRMPGRKPPRHKGPTVSGSTAASPPHGVAA